MLKDHGDINYFDYNTAIDTGKIPEDYLEFWGYEDIKLLDFAKEQLTTLSSKEEPFMLMMETVDTHFPDGYICENCESTFSDQYTNVLRCQSELIFEFIQWCQTQDWYKDTTIVIVGDHLTMKANYFPKDSDYTRTTYNCFINSFAEAKNIKNRQFTELDLFPTILASMGCKIDGDVLGIGTNLFSDKQTLCEKYGYNFVNTELKKKSEFYSNELM